MRRRDAAVITVGFVVVSVISVGLLVVSQQVTSPVELVFFVVPTLFVAFLCAQASRYYLVVSEADMREWEIQDPPDPERTGVESTGDSDANHLPEEE